MHIDLGKKRKKKKKEKRTLNYIQYILGQFKFCCLLVPCGLVSVRTLFFHGFSGKFGILFIPIWNFVLFIGLGILTLSSILFDFYLYIYIYIYIYRERERENKA